MLHMRARRTHEKHWLNQGLSGIRPEVAAEAAGCEDLERDSEGKESTEEYDRPYPRDHDGRGRPRDVENGDNSDLHPRTNRENTVEDGESAVEDVGGWERGLVGAFEAVKHRPHASQAEFGLSDSKPIFYHYRGLMPFNLSAYIFLKPILLVRLNVDKAIVNRRLARYSRTMSKLDIVFGHSSGI
ncbi:hypothetical protein SERLA73DRAFT_152733 [Serpula lacrymans var. lacrymans S7.3]|uniref:Uncharacterized protein n=2 Tax=Serpula lacrymans var. lacrymans TaxID=341189 RepID=F8PYM3_SERL3|nr:uncharacterized protein SERLADRAFT_408494 [Serpula lacrymans var. lacrymans S7.9]EGN98986.1 hypothetical protein SERLA73DRAFT_152733 [Serpula lacrymans var. lacrymans S7.3]EGO24572.1 hypothetical protein SERLADRAFT_408494 [Serpula lacrymans var. lacrymans S7.9]